MHWRWWRTADEMAADFTATREALSHVSFIASCELPDDPLATETAIAVRRSVAAYGMVGSNYIFASDRYPDDLIHLTGWDSLDFVGWVLLLERELGEFLPPNAYDGIRPPFSVKDLVWAIYRFRKAKLNNATS